YKSYINDFVEEARRLKASNQTDSNIPNATDNLLTSLVDASATDEAGEGEGEGSSAGLKEIELLGNIFVLLVAGHETTANTLAWALALLAIDQERQEKLHEHVKSVLGDRDPTYKDYNDLTYVVATMNETLRLYPPVSNIPKKTPRTESKHLGPYLLPPNTHVNINVFAIQRHPKLWGPTSQSFQPERFLTSPTTSSTTTPSEENGGVGGGAEAAKRAWLPFSEGARACLGKRFAQVEFVCALAMLSQKYRWRVPGCEWGGEVPGDLREKVLEMTERLTIVPKNDVRLVVERR
ncbi:hypothetical protein HK102_011692, partial [Quaeritorhiza haematococci]